MRRFALTAVVLTGCGAPATLTTVQTQVFAISCDASSCHKAPGNNGLVLEGSTYERLVNVHAQGPGAEALILVVPGKPEESYLYQKLSKAMPAVGAQMPQNGDALSADRLQLVQEWIAAGARNN